MPDIWETYKRTAKKRACSVATARKFADEAVGDSTAYLGYSDCASSALAVSRWSVPWCKIVGCRVSCREQMLL